MLATLNFILKSLSFLFFFSEKNCTYLVHEIHLNSEERKIPLFSRCLQIKVRCYYCGYILSKEG